jgi:hypothetical protein
VSGSDCDQGRKGLAFVVGAVFLMRQPGVVLPTNSCVRRFRVMWHRQRFLVSQSGPDLTLPTNSIFLGEERSTTVCLNCWLAGALLMMPKGILDRDAVLQVHRAR